jgi:hypothetical protein
MYHDLPRTARFWSFLLAVDQDLAGETRKKACPCGGRLHSANYLRKPRGTPGASYLAIGMISKDIDARLRVALLSGARQLGDVVKYVNKHSTDRVEVLVQVETLLDFADEYYASLEASQAEVSEPLTGGIKTESDAIRALQDADIRSLVEPMNIEYVHFLHRILMMGIAPPGQCGVYRKKSVTVGNPDLWFPPPVAVPQRMLEYCRGFYRPRTTENAFGASVPDIAKVFTELRRASNELRAREQTVVVPPLVGNQLGALFEMAFPRLFEFMDSKDHDLILTAARVSHEFVCIHQYRDGNGRVSRLLMNLAISRQNPPVYLKADKTGRHRYFYALHRADRGDRIPLACLISSNLIEIYGKILKSLGATGK